MQNYEQTDSMDIRPYGGNDREECLQVLDSFSPSASEREAFEAFLDNLPGNYFVMEHDEAIVGGGGYSVTAGSDTASLEWGMIHNNYRKSGLGRFLLLYRIREIRRSDGINMVRVETSPSSAPFFEKQGFRAGQPSGNRVELWKKLTVCP